MNGLDGIELVVFDWDGTVVDSVPAIAGALQLTAADLGLAVPDDRAARHVIGLGMRDALAYAVPDLAESRIPAFLARYRHHYLAMGTVDRPFEGIAGLLDDLLDAGVQLGVATGKSRVGLDRAFEATGYGPRFAVSRCADEGRPKPDPWMLDSIASHTGVARAAIAMVGDTSHDVEMAKAAGVRSVAVSWGAHPLDALALAGPDRVVHSVAELAALFVRAGDRVPACR
ncbi:MAG: HAD family hydrolase [Lautropia sp.]